MTTKLKVWRMYADASQALDVILSVKPNPTSVTPKFGITLESSDTPPGGAEWHDGEFLSTPAWDSLTGRIIATSALIGGDGPLVIESGNTYLLWYNITVGFETFIERCAVIDCP